MPKGTERQEQKTGMQGTFLELEAKNSGVDGLLCATIGRGKTRVLIFPTPAELAVENGERTLSVADFLVVTTFGEFKVIHNENRFGVEDGLGSKDFSLLITKKLGKKFFRPHSGYKNGQLRLGSAIFTTENLQQPSVSSIAFTYSRRVASHNWRLMNASDVQAEKILDLNEKRVEAARATS